MPLTLLSFRESIQDTLAFFQHVGRAWSFLMLGVNLLWVLMLAYAFTNNAESFFWLWNLSVMGIAAVLGMCGYCGYVITSNDAFEDFGVRRYVDAFLGTVFGFLLLVALFYGALTYL